MEHGLRLDEKKSFISGGFVVYLPPLMLRANTINKLEFVDFIAPI